MNTQLVKEKQDLTYLFWSVYRNSSGTAGSFLKSYSELGGKKVYYKLSNFDKLQGVIGHECVNELIVDRLLTILGIPHLPYQLIHADIMLEGEIQDVYLCASDDFKEKGESKIALDAYKEREAEPKESALDFCVRMGWETYIYQMMEDKLCNNFIGSRSTWENLKLIPKDKLPALHPLRESDREIIMEGLDGIISGALQDKIWEMIWKRWCAYEDFCNSR